MSKRTGRAWVVTVTWDDVASRVSRGTVETFSIKAPPSEWAPGDAVYFWNAKGFGRIEAVGTIESIEAARTTRGGVSYAVRYSAGPITAKTFRDQLENDLILADAAFMWTGRRGAITPLSAAQHERLGEIIAAAPRRGSGAAKTPRRTAVPEVAPPRRRPSPAKPAAPAPAKPAARASPRSARSTTRPGSIPIGDHRVLSIHPPWAWAIVHAGKDVENRSWSTPHRGRILIHASSYRYTGDRLHEARVEIARKSGLRLDQIPAEFPRSQVIGMVDLVDVREARARNGPTGVSNIGS